MNEVQTIEELNGLANPSQVLPKRFNVDRLFRRLIPILCIGVAGNLAYTWFATDRQAVDFSGFSIGWLLAAMILAILPWAWHSLRLAIWGKFFGIKISWKNLLRIAVATDVGGVVMPSAVGGAPLKATMLMQHGYRPGQAATVTLWGSIEDALFYILAIPVSLFLTKNWNNPLWTAFENFLQAKKWYVLAFVVGGSLILLLVIKFYHNRLIPANWQVKLKHTLLECRNAFRFIFSKGRKPFLWSMLATSAQWITRFSILLAVVQMLGLEADLSKLLLLQWMVFVAMLVTPTPGATGGAEAAFLLIFTGTISKGAIGIAMAGWRFLAYYFIMTIGAVYLWISNFRSPE